MNTYPKDKDALLKWALSLIVSANLGVLININSKLEKWMEVAINSRKDIEFLQKKDAEQDQRLDKHDAVLFVKPDETKVKYSSTQ